MQTVRIHSYREYKIVLTGCICNIGDGQIDLPEFLSMMSAQMESKEDDKEMIKAFQEFDKNGDGFITQEELKEVMHSTGDVLSDDELNAMIRSADSNKDGQVDFTGE